MSYAQITRADRNFVKRFLHRRRFRDALSLVPREYDPNVLVDFGAGDGELARQLSAAFPSATVFCYEPAPELLTQAAANLAGLANVVPTSRLDDLPASRADFVFALEVFEHLPPDETDESLDAIGRLLADDGTAAIGVPLEIFAPALIKGAFRMTRRPGAFDARPGNVLRASIGRPPTCRPCTRAGPGLKYHKYHLGFDHRRLRRDLASRFEVVRTVCSPLPWLGPWLNAEITFVVRRRSVQAPMTASAALASCAA
jgi:SAM-dependent methyltransferase